jgi:hypothetical protein
VAAVTIVKPADENPAYFQTWWQANIPQAVQFIASHQFE